MAQWSGTTQLVSPRDLRPADTVGTGWQHATRGTDRLALRPQLQGAANRLARRLLTVAGVRTG